MGVSDIAGVLSRKFIVGFFIPLFFGLLALKLLVDERAVPHALRDVDGGTQILILSGSSLVLGLLLWATHSSLIRFLEGYWLLAERLPDRTPATRGEGWAIVPARLAGMFRQASSACHRARLSLGKKRQARWVRTHEHLTQIKNHPARSTARTNAATELNRRYPPEGHILPSEFGNVIRSFEQHPYTRYGMDGIVAWPRISMMLSDSERAELEQATTDLAFWLNSLCVIAGGGSLLLVERLWHQPGGVVQTVLVEAAILFFVWAIATWMYRQAIAAARRWGEWVRAAFDMHRLEAYDRLGVRRPLSPEEDLASGEAIDRLLIFGEQLPDVWRAHPAPAPQQE